MTDELTSNITIASNIYTHKNFEKNVFGFDDLVLLSNKYNFDKSSEQSYLYHQGARPYDCNDKFAWGFVRTADGQIVQSCRCEKTDCSHYKKCMNKSNAKKIVRNSTQINDEVPALIQEPKWMNLEGNLHP
jgi:hypothetical protein